MALVLHKVLRGGTVLHEDMSREAWNNAMRDTDVVDKWGHKPDDCHDPVQRWKEKWVGRIEPVETPEIPPPPAGPVLAARIPYDGPISWPPDFELTAYEMSKMLGLCVDDCKDILHGPWKQLPPVERGPIAGKGGQFLLF